MQSAIHFVTCACERLLWSLSDTDVLDSLGICIATSCRWRSEAVASVIYAKHLQTLTIAQLHSASKDTHTSTQACRDWLENRQIRQYRGKLCVSCASS